MSVADDIEVSRFDLCLCTDHYSWYWFWRFVCIHNYMGYIQVLLLLVFKAMACQLPEIVDKLLWTMAFPQQVVAIGAGFFVLK